MSRKPEERGGWEATTWQGNRIEQHRDFHALPFSKKLELVEEMGQFCEQFRQGPVIRKSGRDLTEAEGS